MGAIKKYESLTILEQKTKNPDAAINNAEERCENTIDASSSLFSKLTAKCDKYSGLCGIILAAMAGIFVTMRSVSVNLVPNLDPTEVFLIRSIIQFVFLIPTLFIIKADPRGPKGTRLLVFLQGLAGSLSALLQFISFSRLPVGEAATIFFSSPVIVMLLSHCFLKETFGVYQIVLVFFFLIGVILIALPGSLTGVLINLGITMKEGSISTLSEPIDIVGLVAAIVGSVLNAVNVMWMRKLQEVNSLVILFSYTVTGLLASSLPTLLWIPSTLPSMPDLAYTILVTIYGVASRILLTMALKLETAGLVAMVYSLAYEVLSYILQIVWFHQIPQPVPLIGTGMIVFAVLALTGESYVKKMFNCECCGRDKQEDDSQQTCLIQK